MTRRPSRPSRRLVPSSPRRPSLLPSVDALFPLHYMHISSAGFSDHTFDTPTKSPNPTYHSAVRNRPRICYACVSLADGTAPPLVAARRSVRLPTSHCYRPWCRVHRGWCSNRKITEEDMSSTARLNGCGEQRTFQETGPFRYTTR